jgi:copper homeostasis protein
MTPNVLVEACVDAIDSALEAERGGAGRIELCGELLQGGVTPSAGLIGAVKARVAARIPVFVLVRPRTGDFLYDDDELDVMRRDIALCSSLGVAGVVLGALTTDGDVDVARLRSLVELARPMSVTFHRAFDFVRDLDRALDALVSLGVDRVLTSGGAATALEGAPALSRLVQRAGDRITVLAGGSITSANVADVVRASGVREVHVRGAEQVRSTMRHRHAGVTLVRPLNASDDARLVTRAGQIRRIVASANARA